MALFMGEIAFKNEFIPQFDTQLLDTETAKTVADRNIPKRNTKQCVHNNCKVLD